MRNDTYTAPPHAYHAQTFPLDPAPFLTPLTRHAPATARDGRVFVLWQDVDLRGVFAELGLVVREAFTNASVLGTGETWLGYVLGMGRQAIHQKARPEPRTRSALGAERSWGMCWETAWHEKAMGQELAILAH